MKKEKPGNYPFTRGIYKNMYNDRLWTMRQYAGFQSARESNKRYNYLIENGVNGLSVAFALPTQIGYDSDHYMAEGEVGKVGVPVSNLSDMEALFDDIQLDEVSDNSAQLAFSQTDNAIHFGKTASESAPSESLSNVVRNSEYRTIMSALENTRSRDQAARVLGISTRNLRHKLQRLREDGMAVTRAYAR